jgi:ATP-dependent Lon protease
MIAFRYLIPRQKTENGLDDGKPLVFLDDAVRFIVRRYTREAGVRNLERQIGTVCRKVARRYAESKDPAAQVTTEVTAAFVEESLGAPRYRPDSEVAERTQRPGIAVGLAWTPVGGDVLFIEAGRMPGGSKGLIMTGQLGSVMQESVQAALTWVRADEVRCRPRDLQDQRYSRPRAGGSDSQGRAFRGRDHGHGAAVNAHR